jgi:hypothetical protein
MILGGGPNLQQPNSEAPVKRGLIPMQRMPISAQRVAKPSFDYEKFFGVMEIIELNQSMFDQLPLIEERRTVPGSERVNALLMYNQADVRDLIKRIGGIPLRLVSETGEAIQGRVTELHDITAGKWGLSFHSQSAEETPKLYHTTQELRAGYLATITSVTNEESVLFKPDQTV